MYIFWIILAILIFLVLSSITITWYFLKKQQQITSTPPAPSSQATGSKEPDSSFKWRYVILPLLFVIISVITVLYFYHLLPVRLAYHFTEENLGDKWIARGWFIFIILFSQFLLASSGVGIALAVAKIGRWALKGGMVQVKSLPGIMAVMSNMVVLPQLILYFAMLDIFSYNAYQVHLLSLFVFTIVVMLAGGLLLAFLFFKAIKKTGIIPDK
jgi:uncharacterized membrane protein